ncbi:MAG: ATP-binding protein [Prevotellaceae bacterium]|jgi:signal transduction histidine kinase|nr:ATP-binding protein [Prevotellaceae bacterium]
MKTRFVETNKEQSADLWPICPTFISKIIRNTKGERLQSVDYNSPNLFGLFEADTLRGFIADAADDDQIQNTLSLFQVVPAEYDDAKTYFGGRTEIMPCPKSEVIKSILGENKKIIRTDTKKLYPISDSCQCFRNSNGKKICFELDSRIAILYHPELLKYHLFDKFDKYVEQLRTISERFNNEEKKGEKHNHKKYNKKYNNKGISIEPYEYKYRDVGGNEQCQKRLYVKYQCPYSLFHEYFFPIVHSGKVVAVLMHGQVIEPGTKKIFSGYRKEIRKVADGIDKAKFKVTESPMNDDRLEAITNRITILETRINEEVISCANKFVLQKFEEIETDFQKSIDDKISSCRSKMTELSKSDFRQILNEALRTVCKIFNPEGFIRLYTPGNPTDEYFPYRTTFNLVGCSDSDIDEGKIPKQYIFEHLPISTTNIEGNDIEGDELARYIFRPSLKCKEYEVFRIQNLLLEEMRILIWKEYTNWQVLYKEQYHKYSNRLKSAYKAFMEPYNVLQRIEVERLLEGTIMASHHEAAQILPLVYSTIEKFDNRRSITSKLIYDSLNRIKLLEGIYNRASLLYRNDEEDKVWEWSDIYRMIYASVSLFEEKASCDNNQCIVIEDEQKKIFPYSKYEIFTVPAYVSHILFNLVDNAIKYGIRGSKIRIGITDVKRNPYSEDAISTFSISIISYGDKIDDKERSCLFELFYRSQEAAKKKQGMGIGLFLAKKMCELLGFEIRCEESKKIADGNLPAIYQYNRQNDINEPLTENQKEVVNTKMKKEDWRLPSESYYKRILGHKIYRNEFVIVVKWSAGNNEYLRKNLINKNSNNETNFIRRR